MNAPVLSVENVGKSYREYGSEWRRFGTWIGWHSRRIKEHWVLRNISFAVQPGEAVGIVGQNGAGKSTLLKIVTGTLGATEGRVRAAGRITAILELGMGFNPDLTGRENVAHSAGLMGFSRAQIDALMSEIEDFAEVGTYFDEPLRTYSSGMQMRVAFSLATAMRPDVLIVDEALSVGDAYFVHKCFKRIRQFREEGTTLLIVSHDKAAIQGLCDRAIMIDKGRLIADDTPQHVLDLYNALISDMENGTITQQHIGGQTATQSGTGEAVIESVYLESIDGRMVEYIGVGDTIDLVVRARLKASIPRLVVGYMLRDRLGQPMYGTNTSYNDLVVANVCTGDIVEMRARFEANLGVGTYSVSIALSSTETHLVNNYEWRDLALVFTVANMGKVPFVGHAWLPPTITVTCNGATLAIAEGDAIDGVCLVAGNT